MACPFPSILARYFLSFDPSPFLPRDGSRRAFKEPHRVTRDARYRSTSCEATRVARNLNTWGIGEKEAEGQGTLYDIRLARNTHTCTRTMRVRARARRGKGREGRGDVPGGVGGGGVRSPLRQKRVDCELKTRPDGIYGTLCICQPIFIHPYWCNNIA